jgi:hypothetical protein
MYLIHHVTVYLNYKYNNNNHGSKALYGLGPPLSEVTGVVRIRGRAAVLSILM